MDKYSRLYETSYSWIGSNLLKLENDKPLYDRREYMSEAQFVNEKKNLYSYIEMCFNQNKLINFIQIKHSFIRLKGIGFDDVKINYDLIINFNKDNSYSIAVDENDVIAKLAFKEIYDSEIKKIIQTVTKFHTQFIKQIIAEKNNS